MWDGSGIVDKASATGNYSDYKLACLIYDAHVLNVWSSNLTIIEQTLWSHQLSNNHIALNYGSLIKNGISKTYNAETDSDVLLAYNPSSDRKDAISGGGVLYSISHVRLSLPSGKRTHRHHSFHISVHSRGSWFLYWR